MQISKILKRRDASSVVVAVILAILVGNAVQGWSEYPIGWFTSKVNPAGNGWNDGLWQPFVALVVGIIILEVVIRIYTWLADAAKKR